MIELILEDGDTAGPPQSKVVLSQSNHTHGRESFDDVHSGTICAVQGRGVPEGMFVHARSTETSVEIGIACIGGNAMFEPVPPLVIVPAHPPQPGTLCLTTESREGTYEEDEAPDVLLTLCTVAGDVCFYPLRCQGLLTGAQRQWSVSRASLAPTTVPAPPLASTPTCLVYCKYALGGVALVGTMSGALYRVPRSGSTSTELSASSTGAAALLASVLSPARRGRFQSSRAGSGGGDASSGRAVSGVDAVYTLGRTIAASATRGAVRVWHVAEGKEIGVVRVAGGDVVSVTLTEVTPTAALLTACTRDAIHVIRLAIPLDLARFAATRIGSYESPVSDPDDVLVEARPIDGRLWALFEDAATGAPAVHSLPLPRSDARQHGKSRRVPEVTAAPLWRRHPSALTASADLAHLVGDMMDGPGDEADAFGGGDASTYGFGPDGVDDDDDGSPYIEALFHGRRFPRRLIAAAASRVLGVEVDLPPVGSGVDGAGPLGAGPVGDLLLGVAAQNSDPFPVALRAAVAASPRGGPRGWRALLRACVREADAARAPLALCAPGATGGPLSVVVLCTGTVSVLAEAPEYIETHAIALSCGSAQQCTSLQQSLQLQRQSGVPNTPLHALLRLGRLAGGGWLHCWDHLAQAAREATPGAEASLLPALASAVPATASANVFAIGGAPIVAGTATAAAAAAGVGAGAGGSLLGGGGGGHNLMMTAMPAPVPERDHSLTLAAMAAAAARADVSAGVAVAAEALRLASHRDAVVPWHGSSPLAWGLGGGGGHAQTNNGSNNHRHGGIGSVRPPSDHQREPSRHVTLLQRLSCPSARRFVTRSVHARLSWMAEVAADALGGARAVEVSRGSLGGRGSYVRTTARREIEMIYRRVVAARDLMGGWRTAADGYLSDLVYNALIPPSLDDLSTTDRFHEIAEQYESALSLDSADAVSAASAVAASGVLTLACDTLTCALLRPVTPVSLVLLRAGEHLPLLVFTSTRDTCEPCEPHFLALAAAGVTAAGNGDETWGRGDSWDGVTVAGWDAEAVVGACLNALAAPRTASVRKAVLAQVGNVKGSGVGGFLSDDDITVFQARSICDALESRGLSTLAVAVAQGACLKLGEAENSDGTTSGHAALMTAVFRYSLNPGSTGNPKGTDWLVTPYHALLGLKPSPHLVRRLVTVAVESGGGNWVAEAPWGGMASMVIGVLEERAREAAAGSVDYYGTLLALHLRRSDYRAAGQCAYECAERLEASALVAVTGAAGGDLSGGVDPETDAVYWDLCAQREKWLLRAVTALSMAPEGSRWVTGAGRDGTPTIVTAPVLRLLHLLSLTPPTPPLPFPTTIDALISMVTEGKPVPSGSRHLHRGPCPGHLAAMDVALALEAVLRSGSSLPSLAGSLSPTLCALPVLVPTADHTRGPCETAVRHLAMHCARVANAETFGSSGGGMNTNNSSSRVRVGKTAQAGATGPGVYGGWRLLGDLLSRHDGPHRRWSLHRSASEAVIDAGRVGGSSSHAPLPPLPFVTGPHANADPLGLCRVLMARGLAGVAARVLAGALGKVRVPQPMGSVGAGHVSTGEADAVLGGWVGVADAVLDALGGDGGEVERAVREWVRVAKERGAVISA